MIKYEMQCSCGEPVGIEAESREEAVENIKAFMTKDAIAAHMEEKHPGEDVPALETVHGMIETQTREVAIA